MRYGSPLVLVWLGLVVAMHGETAGEKQFQVYPLGSADPLASEQAVKVLVGEQGHVVIEPKNNLLLVHASSNHHHQVRALLEELTKPPRNVRIEVVFSGTGAREDAGAALHGHGEVIFGPGGTDASVRLDPRLKHQATTRSTHVTQSLLVASGRTGTLSVGDEVPYVQWLVGYGRQHGYIQQGVGTWRQVGARLVVEPTVLDDGSHIRVKLTPALSGYVDHTLLRSQFARVATEVTVADGQSFSIGGLTKDESFYSKFLVGFDRSGRTQTLDITLTPRVME